MNPTATSTPTNDRFYPSDMTANAPRVGNRVTAEFAFLCRTPAWNTPEGRWEWGVRSATDGPSAAATLLGVFCRLVAAVGEEAAVPSPQLRELLTLEVIHRVRSDPQFRQQFEERVDVAPAFDTLDRRGELDVDRPASAVVTASPSEFVRLVLDSFALRPVVGELRGMIRECERYDAYVAARGDPTGGDELSESSPVE